MSDDDTSSHDSDGELKPEDTLVHGRARRTTAGNRLSVLLQAYGDEDIQNDLLKDEDEDQVDYEASDDGGDVDLESSDESDDEGPPKDGDEEKLEGEKELQKQERVEAKKKKRKAQELLKIGQPKKKVKLADDASTTTATDTPTALKQRKKSERTSWIPTAEDAPTRQSLRNATVLNKELTEVKLRESQKRSEKAHEMLRIAAEKRAANAVPALTQADRIARALKTEKENSKSLNRWVQVEEERRTAQRKRLEALRNRQIEGPVIRYWSASAIWEGDKIKVKRVHQPKVELVDEAQEKATVTEKTQDTQSATQPNASCNSTPLDASAGQQVDKNTSDAETATAAAKAEDDPKKQPGHAITESDELDKEAVQTPIEAPQQHPDAMQIDTTTPTTGTEIDATKSSSILPSSNSNPNDEAIEPPKNTDKPIESFLDGIHYWASQSPAEPDNKHAHVAASTRPGQSPVTNTNPSSNEPFPSLPQHSEKLTPEQPNHLPSAIPEPDVHVSSMSAPETHTAESLGGSVTAPTVLHEPAPMSNTAPIVTSSPNTFPSATPYVFPGYQFLQGSTTTPPSVAAIPQESLLSSEASLPSLAPPVPLLQEQALRTLLTLSAFPELEKLPVAPTTTSSRSKAGPAPSTIAITSILVPSSHPSLTSAEQKYLTARSLKKKGDNFLPDRPPKASCCITAKEAKFRDPKTRLGYRDLAAFKSLQRVLAGGCAWSVNEGCWVGIVGDGRMGRVAQGVPEGFWSGILPPKKDIVKVEEGSKGDMAASSVVPASSQSAPLPAAPPPAAHTQSHLAANPQAQRVVPMSHVQAPPTQPHGGIQAAPQVVHPPPTQQQQQQQQQQ